MSEDVRAWWEATAGDFQDEANVEVGLHWGRPEIDDDRMVGDVEDAEVLELGCGGGQLTVGLAERGATVTGVDLSTEQLEFARALTADHGVDDAISLVHGDVTDLPVDDERFDVACNAFVFQWVDDVESCFEEVYRVLRPGGRFAFSTPHPSYRLLDPETGTVEESYFDTGRHVRETAPERPDLVTYRNTVADYHEALRAAGFEVTALLEPGSPDPEDYEPGPWGQKRPELLCKVPSVLAVAARKPA
jgi:SAM-dependent methyltransferase